MFISEVRPLIALNRAPRTNRTGVAHMRISARLFAGVAPVVLGVALTAAPAFAQDQDAQDQEAAADEVDASAIVVTGSRIVRDGSSAPVPTTVVTMEDLVSAVGVDAARYALARSPINSNLDIDLEQLAKKTNDNPVFYVQYAHARTKQVAVNAASLGVDNSEFKPELLNHPSESDLLAKLIELPRVMASAAELKEPHRVARYLEEVAGAYHRWYDSCRVTPLAGNAVDEVHRTRLWLNNAAGVVLRNGLYLLGVSAPERM